MQPGGHGKRRKQPSCRQSGSYSQPLASLEHMHVLTLVGCRRRALPKFAGDAHIHVETGAALLCSSMFLNYWSCEAEQPCGIVSRLVRVVCRCRARAQLQSHIHVAEDACARIAAAAAPAAFPSLNDSEQASGGLADGGVAGAATAALASLEASQTAGADVICSQLL